jgi:hypothetical protein
LGMARGPGPNHNRGPVVPCPGLGGQQCGAPVRPPGINPDHPNVCHQCLERNGIWPARGAPPPKGLE